MDPYMGELANIPEDKLIEWLFYCVDKKSVKVDAIFWEGHCLFEQEMDCFNTDIYRKFKQKGIDIMARIIDECHKRGIKAYCHHRFSEVELSPGNEIKEKHKDWVIKTWWDEGLWNLASEGLQEFKLNYITKIMQRYPFDGISIDFLRHLPCLPVGAQWENRKRATKFISKLKENMNKLGRKIMVGAKLPENEKACHVDGFDVETWAESGIVDFLICGSRTVNSEIDWYKKVTKGTSTEVYACWDGYHLADAQNNQTSDFYRGMISNWKKKGTDGIVAFNFAPAPRKVLKKLLPPEEILNCLAQDYSDFYNILNDENLENKELKFTADRKYGYPFLEGAGGNNIFAPLPAAIPNDEAPLDINLDVCGDYKDRNIEIRFIITNAKPTFDKFEILLNGVKIKEFIENYSYIDKEIFWPAPQPEMYTANSLNENPAHILEIKARVDSGLVKNGRNSLSISVKRTNVSGAISVERAEIIVGDVYGL